MAQTAPGVSEEMAILVPTASNTSAQLIVSTQVFDGRVVADISPGVIQ